MWKQKGKTMKNVYVIDLFRFGKHELTNILNEYDTPFTIEDLVRYKSNGYAKIFISHDTNEMIAYTTNSAKNIIVFSTKTESELMALTSLGLEKEDGNIKVSTSTTQKISEKVQLTPDEILEKITNFGINSLSKEEKVILQKWSESQ